MPPGGRAVSGVRRGLPLSLHFSAKALSVQPSYRKSVKAPMGACNARIEHFAYIGGKLYGLGGIWAKWGI